MPTATRCPDPEAFRRLLRGLLPPAAQARHQHPQTCAACRAALQALQAEQTAAEPAAAPTNGLAGPADPKGPLLGQLLDDQRRRWQGGEAVPVESYLRQHPGLGGDAGAVLDLRTAAGPCGRTATCTATSPGSLRRRRRPSPSWAEVAAEMGGSPDARRVQLDRAVRRVSYELGLEPDADE
jgi:hypothetical protein